jgi:hypothetical protein
MSYYAIGIGGTGGKCLEALIHIAACGLLPDNEPLYLLFVDKDGSNGSVGRASKLLKVYNDACVNRIAGTDFLKTPLRTALSPVWSPVPGGYNDLHGFLGYDVLSEDHRILCDVLYSSEEIMLPLEKGFRGHPSIGAAFMANTVDLENTEPWKTMQQQMIAQAQNKEVKLMLFGSIFGGTGASGFPTISRLIENWKKGFSKKPLHVAGVLMLPYFSFDPVDNQGLKVDSKDFSLSTQAALQYYCQKNELSGFDTTFVIGSDDVQQVRASALGGQEQENDPHWAELYAALATVEFFKDSELKMSGYHVIAREKTGALQWSDLPNHNEEVKTKILQMARFSFAFLSSYYPMLVDIAGDGQNEHAKGQDWRAPWYIDFFTRKGVNAQNCISNELEQIRQYCSSFLWWLASIEYSVTGKISDKGVSLLNFTSFAEEEMEDNKASYLKIRAQFTLDDFANIRLPHMKSSSDLANLWDRMCQAQPRGNNNDSSWLFVNELYRQCSK